MGISSEIPPRVPPPPNSAAESGGGYNIAPSSSAPPGALAGSLLLLLAPLAMLVALKFRPRRGDRPKVTADNPRHSQERLDNLI